MCFVEYNTGVYELIETAIGRLANSITVVPVSNSNKHGRNTGRGDDGRVCGRGRGRGRGDDGRGDGRGLGCGNSGRGEIIATALTKAAESATDNLMEVKVKNVMIKHGQFI